MKKINKAEARRNANIFNNRKHRKNVIALYKHFLRTIRKYSRKGYYYIESGYIQVHPNLEGYIALRLLSYKTDFLVKIMCDDEEYADHGTFNYGKWAQNMEWDTRYKYSIQW